ncbi:unnamed protein product, partial [Candidula unifasciata]
EYCFPVKIYVTDKIYDILVPDTKCCKILRKANTASMSDSDSMPGFKEDRLAVEEKISEAREQQMCVVRLAQDKVNKLNACFPTDSLSRTKTAAFNTYGQEYLYDPILQDVLEERGQAMSEVDRLWADVLVRNPYLSKIITKIDLKALSYLRRLDVEEFRRGYRFHFYFDPNPYFYNKHLCKEVFTDIPKVSANCVVVESDEEENLPCASSSIPVLWKKCRV